MKKKTVVVDDDFEFIIVSALRYAIGRRSYAPGLVSEYIKRIWDKLTNNCQFLLIRDLQREIADADRGLESKIFKYDPLGDKCDRETWTNLNIWMKERVKYEHQ